MDPRFQPQSNYSYQQNPSGYSQANPYYPQETNLGPNKYPTLPPAQNQQNPQYPQYNHGSQQNYHPQPSSQQNYAPHSYPQYNPHVKEHPGYVPPPQYGNTQHRLMNDRDSEKARLDGEMKELERELDGCHLQCYTYWSCIVAVVAFLAFLTMLFAFISSSKRIDLAIFLLGCCWLIVQSYFAFASVQSRSVTPATVACWMMVITLIPSLFGEVIAVSVLVHARGSGEKAAGIFFTIFLSLHLVTHIFLNMIGAFNVRKILVERAKIEMKLVENSFNNHA